jgi:26S proteasome regulatory subunit N12
LGCFLAIEGRNVRAFSREFAKLKVFYNEYGAMLEESKQKQLLIGLHLCSLLANNQIDEFHTELELITAQNVPAPQQEKPNSEAMQLEPLRLERKESLTDTLYSSAFIRYPVTLEQHLMEGSYNKIFAARKAMPSKYFSLFLDILSTTVRVKIAECSERAYQTYPVKDAVKLLLFTNEKELSAFCEQRGWTIKGGKIIFAPNQEKAKPASGVNTLQTHATIKQMFDYANELERII